MNLKKPKFWLKKNFLSYIIFPLSIITHTINFLKKVNHKKKFNIKTICIGNIFVGGTGKTSLSIKINQILKNKYKTVLIKKYYINQTDEINLLKKAGDVISKNERLESLKIAQRKYDLAILDDGLQQKNIHYDFKIVCFNSHEFIGNNFLLPAGPLRESFNEIKNYDIIFLNGENNNINIKKKIKSVNKNLKIFEGFYNPINLKNFNINKNYLMFCGIGNPQEFEKTLSKYKFKIKKKVIFGDHYKLSNKEIGSIKNISKKNKLQIITTEKDYLRLNPHQRKGIKYLKINLKIKNLNKLKKILSNI